MTQKDFIQLLSQVTGRIAGLPVDVALGDLLNQDFPVDSLLFKAIQTACAEGTSAGWMCQQEYGGLKFGRVAKPCPELHGFSIDVVDMNEVVGPHHRHPLGEIDMIMPLEGDARFDGHGAGWFVYGPDSAHNPTMTGGPAYVLYLLPEGAIEFTRK